MKLTNTTIKQLIYEKAGNKADLRFDNELRGFGIRVYPSGRRSYFITYRNSSGTKKRHTLGDFGSLTATEARRLAQDRLSEVRKGTDPQADRQASRQQMTFDDLANRYLDHHEGRKKSLKADRQRLRDHICPVVGRRKLSEITLAQLERLQRKIRDKLSPATANRCVALIKHIFNTAGKWGLLEVSPARHLSMFREPPPRDIVLKPDECRRILDGCDADENIFAAEIQCQAKRKSWSLPIRKGFRSEADYAVVYSLRFQYGYDPDDLAALLQYESEKAAERGMDYVIRTVNAAL